jgi:hypothetical protein
LSRTVWSAKRTAASWPWPSALALAEGGQPRREGHRLVGRLEHGEAELGDPRAVALAVSELPQRVADARHARERPLAHLGESPVIWSMVPLRSLANAISASVMWPGPTARAATVNPARFWMVWPMLKAKRPAVKFDRSRLMSVSQVREPLSATTWSLTTSRSQPRSTGSASGARFCSSARMVSEVSSLWTESAASRKAMSLASR